jgi:hypothetical protein
MCDILLLTFFFFFFFLFLAYFPKMKVGLSNHQSVCLSPFPSQTRILNHDVLVSYAQNIHITHICPFYGQASVAFVFYWFIENVYGTEWYYSTSGVDAAESYDSHYTTNPSRTKESHDHTHCTHLSDESEANDGKSNKSDSDSRESNFDNTEWEDVTENNDNQPQANFQYQEWHRPKQCITSRTLLFLRQHF